MTAFELAVQDLAGVRIARAAGVDRIELCAALSAGGLTPSRGLIDAAVDAGVPVHVLIRPRPGNFEYTAEERLLCLADAQAAIDAGAAGVVVGAVRDGRVDEEFVRTARDVAPHVTFHRAFDTVPDQDRGLDDLLACGADRVLTSGGRARAIDALDELRHLVRRGGDRIEIVAGSGITPRNVRRVAATGVAAVHASAKRHVNDALPFALGSAADAGYETTDENAVRGLIAAVRGMR